jgi:hypothetical protein
LNLPSSTNPSAPPQAAVWNGDVYFAKPELNSPPAAATTNLPSIYWGRVKAAGNLCDNAVPEVSVASEGVVSATQPDAAPLALGVPAVGVDPAGRVHLAYACGSPQPAGGPMYAGEALVGFGWVRFG